MSLVPDLQDINRDKSYKMEKIKLLCITCPRKDINYQKQVELACLGGADMIQFRDKNITGKALIKLARELHSIAGSFNVPFILNDDPAAAKEAGCDGVHIGQDDMPYDQARKIMSYGIIGISAQSFKEAVEAAKTEADYIGFGPIFTTPNKKGPEGIGIGEIKKLALEKINTPIIAIGGIDESNVKEIIQAGADGIAVIRAVCGAANIKNAAKKMKELITEAGTK